MSLAQVEKHKLKAVEAIKNKEETELKCQQKIADMVALMEKHKVRSWFTYQCCFSHHHKQIVCACIHLTIYS